MRAYSISKDNASEFWIQQKNQDEIKFNISDAEIIGADEEELLSDYELEALVEALEEVKSNYPSVTKQNAGSIDSDVSVIVHSHLSDKLSVDELSQIGFWRWLSIIACDGFFWRFIDWRIGGDAQINWGVVGPNNRFEVYFYRGWLRGHKMFEPEASDPYKYAKKGASDMWRSQILRQEFGRDKEFVKAFLDTVYDEQGKTIVGTNELRKDLIPAIRAWTSSGIFSHLSYSENLELLKLLKEQGA